MKLQKHNHNPFKKPANDLADLLLKKNIAYGNSFADSADFLKLLFPDGVPVEKYGDMLTLVRVFDKQKRIANRKDAFGENPWSDIAGYGLLMVNQELNLTKKRRVKK